MDLLLDIDFAKRILPYMIAMLVSGLTASWFGRHELREIFRLFRAIKTVSAERPAQSEESDQPSARSAVANAELILHLLLKPDEAEAVGGDLQERYSRKVERFGKRRASVWLWSQVLRSIWPLLKRFFTAGGFLAAADFIRKLLS